MESSCDYDRINGSTCYHYHSPELRIICESNKRVYVIALGLREESLVVTTIRRQMMVQNLEDSDDGVTALRSTGFLYFVHRPEF
jgi:hypothetical protein